MKKIGLRCLFEKKEEFVCEAENGLILDSVFPSKFLSTELLFAVQLFPLVDSFESSEHVRKCRGVHGWLCNALLVDCSCSIAQ